MSKSEAALQIIGANIINVSQECFAQASNLFNLDVKSDEVTIDGLTVNANKSTSVGRCSTNTGISEGILHSNLDQSLSTISTISANGVLEDAYTGSSIDMKTTIKDSIRTDVINRCLAVALNSIMIRVKDARVFTIKNVNIQQDASAEIKDCIGNVDINIGDKAQTLEQFLRRNESSYNVEGYKTPKNCPHYKTIRENVIVIASSALSGAVLIIAILFLFYYLQKKKNTLNV